ncbi:MAG: response regulator [Rhodocyclales bacterium GT-UBC]|nr:MAG: response regulator [Rhodocyclales bacterium GT-UBC]
MKAKLVFLNWHSLRTRITVGALVVSLAVLWIAVAVLSQSLRHDMEAAISAQQFSSVSLIANALDRSIHERMNIAESIAAKVTPELMQTPGAAQSYLELRDVPESIFNWGILIVDTQGLAIASTPERLNRRGANFIDYPKVRESLRGERIFSTDPLFSQHSQQPVVGMFTPIKSADGTVIGAVIGVTNLSQHNFFDDISTGKYGNTGDFFVTAPGNRAYVASSDKRRVMKIGPPPGINPVYDRYIDGYEGSGIALSSRGVVELSSSKRIPSTGWLMQSVLPAEEAFAPIRAMQRHLILISALLTILATLISWWWLQRQFMPLREASTLLSNMRDGKIPRQPLPVHTMDEIGQLTSAFNGLQETILAEEAQAAEHAANTRLRRIVSYLPGVVFQYRLLPDDSGNFPFVSDAITGIYGVTPEELAITANQIRAMLHPNDEKRFLDSLHNSARNLTPWRIEYRIVHPTDGVKWLLVNAIPEASNDNTITWYGFIADITETKAMEAELRRALSEQKSKDAEIARYRDHLEQLVSTRTADLELARAEAERLARIKSEFLANMSHEIRTPLNGVLGMARIGQRASPPDSKAYDTFAKIVSSGTLLLGIINDILDLSKMEAGMLKIEITRVELPELLEDSLELVRERAGAKGIRLSLEIGDDFPNSCQSDPLRLRQVLLNLLANAVKFTESGSITLSANRDGDWLVISVADTGIGISASQLGVIFNPFEQGDNSTTRKFGGTGLGLAITERIVKQMGGDIMVDSLPGHGSIFEVRLPYRESQPPVATPPPTFAIASTVPGKPLAGLNILVAEDNDINQEILQENLSEDGASVVIASDGQQAVELVRQNSPRYFDIVLMDVQMPILSGHDAARQICAIAPGLPIIGQTAHALAQDRSACLAAGMVDYIAKPIEPEKLVQLILKHVSKS